MRVNNIHSSPNSILATTLGLVKTINEDRLGYRKTSQTTRICICDGHWGIAAANLAKSKILNSKSFPKNSTEVISLVENIQGQIFERFGHEKMDSERDFTPETSLLAIEIDSAMNLNILSYGDIRLMITQSGKIKYKHKTKKTWLGSFSFLGLRGRLSVNVAAQFKRLVCNSQDLIWLFTDGVDECHYEQPTVALEWFAKLGSENKNLKTLVSKVFNEVKRFGAEDNASIAIIRC